MHVAWTRDCVDNACVVVTLASQSRHAAHAACKGGLGDVGVQAVVFGESEPFKQRDTPAGARHQCGRQAYHYSQLPCL